MAESLHINLGGGSAKAGFRQQLIIRRLIENALEDILDFAHDAAVGTVPKRTGNLARNITTSDVSRTGNFWSGHVGVGKTAPYAPFVESGTGIYGPSGMPIVPKTAKMLRWETSRIRTRRLKDGAFLKKPVRFTTVHFARSVRGQRGRGYMRRAYQATNTFYVPTRLAVLEREIQAVLRLT